MDWSPPGNRNLMDYKWEYLRKQMTMVDERLHLSAYAPFIIFLNLLGGWTSTDSN